VKTVAAYTGVSYDTGISYDIPVKEYHTLMTASMVPPLIPITLEEFFL